MKFYGLIGTFYRGNVHRLKKAFRAATAPFKLEIEELNDEAKAFDNRVKASEAKWQEIDEDGQVVFDHGEALGERISDAEDTLIILRKAFAILAYHTWERGALKWFAYPTKRPTHQHFVTELQEAGCIVDVGGLRDLNNLANCLKHNSKNSGPQLHTDRPDLFDPLFNPAALHPATGKPHSSIDWESYIALTDSNMDSFFETVSVSSPK